MLYFIRTNIAHDKKQKNTLLFFMNRMFVGLVAAKEGGKTTVARRMVHENGFDVESFAFPLKRIAQIFFGFSDRELYGDLKERVNPWIGVSARRVLQVLGTEGIRDAFSKDEYVAEILSKFTTGKRGETFWVTHMRHRVESIFSKNPEAKVVIDDVRFPDEISFVEEVGGKIVFLDRDFDKIPRPAAATDDSIRDESPEPVCFSKCEFGVAGAVADAKKVLIIPSMEERLTFSEFIAIQTALEHVICNVMPKHLPELAYGPPPTDSSDASINEGAQKRRYATYNDFFKAFSNGTLEKLERDSKGGQVSAFSHASEAMSSSMSVQSNIDSKCVIINDGTLEQLYDRMDAVLAYIQSK